MLKPVGDNSKARKFFYHFNRTTEIAMTHITPLVICSNYFFSVWLSIEIRDRLRGAKFSDKPIAIAVISADCFHQQYWLSDKGDDPYGTEGHVPPILWRGTSMVMCPPIFWGLFYLLTATTVVCCILMQIFRVVSQKKLQLLCDFVPQTSYRGSRPQVFFYVPSIILWDWRPCYLIIRLSS